MVTLLLLHHLLSTNLGVRLPFTSSLPWLDVPLPLVAQHVPPHLPRVLMPHRLLLLSYHRAPSTSHCLEALQAFKMQACPVRWRLRLVVSTPLVELLPPLVLLLLCRLLSADTSPPICLLLASALVVELPLLLGGPLKKRYLAPLFFFGPTIVAKNSLFWSPSQPAVGGTA